MSGAATAARARGDNMARPIRQQLNWLFRIIRACVPPALRDAPNVSIRAENLAVTCLLGLTVIPSYGFFYLALDDPESAHCCFFAFGGVATAMLVLRLTGAIAVARDLLAGSIFLLLLALIYRTGGVASPSIIWLAVCPLLATAAGGPRIGLVWTGTVLAAVAGTYAGDIRKLFPAPVVNDFDLLSFVSTASFIMLIAVFLLIYERLNAAAIARLDQALDVIHSFAIHDELTGLLNRREVLRVAEQEKERADRHGVPLSLCIFDIDHFKSINDTWGHSAGDGVLRHMAECIHGEVRKSDCFGRYGGEEFLLVLVGADGQGARDFVERVRQSVEAMELAGLDGRRVTVSAGVAENAAGETIAQVLARADASLYRAKHAGRNRVELETTSATAPTSPAYGLPAR
ncbi:GGDEF domain-containing protein [Oxalobacteraceae bacterium OM1]|nr:GGDEF domain-containing protein [Oxalobacteraceae bacterium OM1]